MLNTRHPIKHTGFLKCKEQATILKSCLDPHGQVAGVINTPLCSSEKKIESISNGSNAKDELIADEQSLAKKKKKLF